MLSRDTFNAGIEKLNTEYRDRGFTMTKEKALQWYDFMKDMSNSEFKKKVKNCLMTCKRVPFMADILNPPQNDNSFEPANAGAYEIL